MPDSTDKAPRGIAHLPEIAAVPDLTDFYFNRTKQVVAKFGDKEVTYAVFMRRPVISTPRLVVEFLEKAARARGVTFKIELVHKEGEWVGAGDPMLYITGSLHHLIDLETLYL